MAITHSFADAADLRKGGTWFSHYGERICTWTWDPATREIEVRCGPNGKRRTLPDNVAKLTSEELPERLKDIAIEMAGQIRAVTYDL